MTAAGRVALAERVPPGVDEILERRRRRRRSRQRGRIRVAASRCALRRGTGATSRRRSVEHSPAVGASSPHGSSIRRSAPDDVSGGEGQEREPVAGRPGWPPVALSCRGPPAARGAPPPRWESTAGWRMAKRGSGSHRGLRRSTSDGPSEICYTRRMKFWCATAWMDPSEPARHRQPPRRLRLPRGDGVRPPRVPRGSVSAVPLLGER